MGRASLARQGGSVFQREEWQLPALADVRQRVYDPAVELGARAGAQLTLLMFSATRFGWGAGGAGLSIAAVGAVVLFTVPLIVGEWLWRQTSASHGCTASRPPNSRPSAMRSEPSYVPRATTRGRRR